MLPDLTIHNILRECLKSVLVFRHQSLDAKTHPEPFVHIIGLFLHFKAFIPLYFRGNEKLLKHEKSNRFFSTELISHI